MSCCDDQNSTLQVGLEIRYVEVCHNSLITNFPYFAREGAP